MEEDGIRRPSSQAFIQGGPDGNVSVYLTSETTPERITRDYPGTYVAEVEISTIRARAWTWSENPSTETLGTAISQDARPSPKQERWLEARAGQQDMGRRRPGRTSASANGYTRGPANGKLTRECRNYDRSADYCAARIMAKILSPLFGGRRRKLPSTKAPRSPAPCLNSSFSSSLGVALRGVTIMRETVACWTCDRTVHVWRLRERNFCSGKCRVSHHRSRVYRKLTGSALLIQAPRCIDIVSTTVSL